MADIELRIDTPIAVVALNRPAERNSVTLAMWHGLTDIFKSLDDDKYVRAIILTGAGGNFSVGADVSEFNKVRSNSRQSAEYEMAVDACSDVIGAVSKPVIAVIEGYCLGGGCHLSMPCDFRFVHIDASFGIPAAKLSIVYGIRSTQRLLSLVGLANAKRVLYSAERFNADEALKMGFADRVSDNPLEEAKTFAANMATRAPLSVAGAKLILNGLAIDRAGLDWETAQEFIDRVSDSTDYEEGRRAFVEKRAPVFEGK